MSIICIGVRIWPPWSATCGYTKSACAVLLAQKLLKRFKISSFVGSVMRSGGCMAKPPWWLKGLIKPNIWYTRVRLLQKYRKQTAKGDNLWQSVCTPIKTRDPYALDFLKQSMHFRLDVSRGSKGREVIAASHPLHFQSPEKRGRSPSCFCGLDSPPFLFLWHSRHRSPVVFLGSNGNSVIAPPHPLHVQFP